MRTKFAIALAIVAVCVTAARAGWNDEFQITDNELQNETGGSLTRAHYVVIGADDYVDGIVHIVWRAEGYVYYKRYYPGSGWSEEQKIGEDQGDFANHPGIALDANGKDIHVVWHSSKTSTQGKGKNRVTTTHRTIYYWECVVTGAGTGGWVGDPTDLCEEHVSDYYYRDYPSIACGADGQVVAAWQELRKDVTPYVYSVVFREYDDGWQDERVVAGPFEDHFYGPSIAADDDGNVFVSYTQHPSSSFGHVFVGRRIGGDWEDWEDATPGDDLFGTSAIEVNPQTGNPHLICLCCEDNGTFALHIFHTYRTETGWEPIEMISEPAGKDMDARLLFTGDGTAHAVWDGYDSDTVYDYVKYASCPNEGGTWTDPVPLTSVSVVSDPDIAGGTDGTLLAAWEYTEVTLVKKKEVRKTDIWGIYDTPEGGGGQAQPLALSKSCFELFPNPAKAGRVAVHYSLSRAGQMTVTLVDISGRVVQTQQVLAAGRTGTASIDVNGLSAGVYMARLVAGDLNASQPLVIAR